MSDVDGTCEYVLDPDDPETWSGGNKTRCYVSEEYMNEDGVWSCPHDAEENYDLCIFHLPIEKKVNDEVTRKFLDEIEKADDGTDSDFQNRKRQFIGGIFKDFHIPDGFEYVGGNEDENGVINISHAEIDGYFDWQNTTFWYTDLVMNGTELKGEANFEQITVGGKANFIEVSFRGYTNFFEATFIDAVSFDFSNFKEESHFNGTMFEGDCHFDLVEFNGDAYFANAKFSESVTFYGEFNGGAFFDSRFEGNTSFDGTSFNNGGSFGTNLDLVSFRNVDFSGVSLTNANLRETNMESTILSRSILFGADLRGAKLFGAVLGDVRINEDTKFLGHPSDDGETSPHTLSAIRSQPKCVYDPDYEDDNEHEDMDKAKSVYRALEELGGKHALPRLQTRAFVRRQDLQKDGYKRVMVGREKGDDEDEREKEGPSLEERFIAGLRYSRAKLARTTILYGESPWRIIGWSLGIITFFAFLYPYYGLIESSDAGRITWSAVQQQPSLLIDSFYFSTITYTALELGGFSPANAGGQIATIIESGFGVVLLALLVFVFGRRATR